MKQIYQIQVALQGFSPKIWRRILIPSDFLLSDFHKVIQTAMGWTNSHLHQFIKEKERVCYCEKFDDDWLWEESGKVDYQDVKISDLLEAVKDKIVYEYDFGDSWEHDIIVEKILPVDEKTYYPVCVAGKMSCPPEDCGGVWGYADLLEILAQPKHEDYASMLEWIGDDFDPKFFDREEVNELLADEDFGCFDEDF